MATSLNDFHVCFSFCLRGFNRHSSGTFKGQDRIPAERREQKRKSSVDPYGREIKHGR